MSVRRLLDALGDALRERATGVVEWRRDRDRRLFFVDEGELVLLQSNVKDDSLERFVAEHGEMEPAQARARLLEARVAHALAETGGDAAFTPGVLPPQRSPADLVALVWSATDALPPLPQEGWPEAQPGAGVVVGRLPVGDVVRDYLLALDGTRAVEDVLDFGPDDPAAVGRALRVAAALGAVRFDTAEASATHVVTGPPSRAPRAPLGDDIGDLIRGELGDDAHTAPAPSGDPVEARFGALLPRIRDAKDHFQVLGMSWQDPPEALRRAYFQLAKELHPDRFVAEPAAIQAVASDLFDKVRSAWEVLGDEETRKTYIARTIHGELSEEEKAMERVRVILDAEAAFRKGMVELRAGRLPAAHELFQKATEGMPEEHEFAAYAGYTTWKLNAARDEAAAEEGARRLKAALDANEKLDGAWVLHGMVLAGKGQAAAARKAFVTALKLKPSNPDAVREMKRLERAGDAAPPEPTEGGGGFFSKLFGKKK